MKRSSYESQSDNARGIVLNSVISLFLIAVCLGIHLLFSIESRSISVIRELEAIKNNEISIVDVSVSTPQQPLYTDVRTWERINASSTQEACTTYITVLNGNSSRFTYAKDRIHGAGYDYYYPDEDVIQIAAKTSSEIYTVSINGTVRNHIWETGRVSVEFVYLEQGHTDVVPELCSEVLYSIYGVQRERARKEISSELSTWTLDYEDNEQASFEFGNIGCEMYTWEGDGIEFLTFGIVHRDSTDPRYEADAEIKNVDGSPVNNVTNPQEVFWSEAQRLYAQGDLEGAAEQLELAGNYKGAAEQAKDIYYVLGQQYLDSGDYDASSRAFTKATPDGITDDTDRIIDVLISGGKVYAVYADGIVSYVRDE